MGSPQTGHVGLNVSDLDRSRDFYVKLLGYTVQSEGSDGDRRWAFLSNDGTLVLTLWQQSTGAFPVDRPGLHHLSFQVDDMDQVRSAEAVLRDLGVELVHDGAVAHREGGRSGGIFFSDPDGIRLEIYATNGAEELPAPQGTTPTCGFF
ncbi:VOC family protein [Nocardiopsis gilva YIM 90087]|uniref:VOC family protein n=1 Tax=Nocardiopsis gilva YIM 90087 TaxID=1235441 RepID=A0A223SCF4_9ACTN|nr:VOC family protein [Nocardiopsis gilva]ASU85851.1 VOC family protein [Nocardiopsis gilva YIM 90087]